MKRTILILLIALGLSGCFPENQEGCPADMRISFYLDDPYESGNFDSRIGNNVLLYIFQNDKLTHSEMIPYNKISMGKEYVIRKTAQIEGKLKFIAWSVPVGEDVLLYPNYAIGALFGNQFLELSNTRAVENRLPYPHKLYLGVLSSEEAIDKQTQHKIGLHTGVCRIEVNVTDQTKLLGSQEPKVSIFGSMTRMNLKLEGVGSQATVSTELSSDGGDLLHLSTGRFGVLPSSQGQNLSVDIFNKDSKLATLTVPSDNLPKGAQSGGLIIFDYEMGSAEFFITVDGYTQKIVIIDEM